VTEILTAVRPTGTMHPGRPGLPIQNLQGPCEGLTYLSACACHGSHRPGARRRDLPPARPRRPDARGVRSRPPAGRCRRQPATPRWSSTAAVCSL
jgi:hypothetical protein